MLQLQNPIRVFSVVVQSNYDVYYSAKVQLVVLSLPHSSLLKSLPHSSLLKSLPHSLHSSLFKSLSNQLPTGEDVSYTVSPSFPEFQNNWNHGGQIYSLGGVAQLKPDPTPLPLGGAADLGPDVVVVVGSSATIEHVYEFVDKTYEEKVKDVE